VSASGTVRDELMKIERYSCDAHCQQCGENCPGKTAWDLFKACFQLVPLARTQNPGDGNIHELEHCRRGPYSVYGYYDFEGQLIARSRSAQCPQQCTVSVRRAGLLPILTQRKNTRNT